MKRKKMKNVQCVASFGIESFGQKPSSWIFLDSESCRCLQPPWRFNPVTTQHCRSFFDDKTTHVSRVRDTARASVTTKPNWLSNSNASYIIVRLFKRIKKNRNVAFDRFVHDLLQEVTEVLFRGRQFSWQKS